MCQDSCNPNYNGGVAMPAVIYPIRLKKAMVEKYLRSDERISDFSKANGIPESSLRDWIREAESGILESMKKPKHMKYLKPDEKFEALMEYNYIEKEDEQGFWLRKNGLKKAHLDKWKKELSDTLRMPKPDVKEKKIIKALEKEIKRKDKALAEVTALLVMKKKADAIWGNEEEES